MVERMTGSSVAIRHVAKSHPDSRLASTLACLPRKGLGCFGAFLAVVVLLAADVFAGALFLAAGFLAAGFLAVAGFFAAGFFAGAAFFGAGLRAAGSRSAVVAFEVLVARGAA